MSPFLKRRQPIAESYPADVMTKPGMVRRWEGPRIVEAARCDVDGWRGTAVLVCQWCSARSAKRTAHRWTRMKLRRTAVS